MHAIIQNEYCIGSIHQVLHNTMIKRYVHNDQKGRYSDCLVYVLSGKTKYLFNDGRTLAVGPKDILYLAKGSLYCMDILTDIYEVLYVDFDFVTDTPLYSDKFTLPTSENLELLFRKLNRKWILQTSSRRCESYIVLYTIYTALIQYFSQPYLPSSAKKQLAPALDYIATHYTDPDLSIGKLAEISGISEGHFRRLFKNLFSVSPNQYIRTMRINQARQLLQFSTQNISGIAELAGFENPFYFCRIFKQETGYTPTEYRQCFGEVLP